MFMFLLASLTVQSTNKKSITIFTIIIRYNVVSTTQLLSTSLIFIDILDKISNVTRTWLWRSQSEVSTDGGGDNNAQYSEANHDHDLLLLSALTDINRNLIQLITKLFFLALSLSLSLSLSLTLFPKIYPHLFLFLPFYLPCLNSIDYSYAQIPLSITIIIIIPLQSFTYRSIMS